MRNRAIFWVFAWVILPFSSSGEAFRASIRSIRTVENGAFTLADIESNGERFSLVVPRGWKTSVRQEENTLSIYSPTGDSPITIRFSPDDPQPLLASTETLRKSIVPFLTEATVTEEFPVYSGLGAGRGIDLSFLLQGSSTRARAAVIPLSKGFVSFTLTCSADKWPVVQQSFGTILTTFQRASTESSEEFVRLEKDWQEQEQKVQVKSTAPEPGRPPEPFRVPINAASEMEVPEEASSFEGKGSYVFVGLLLAILAITRFLLKRPEDEAEIRLLAGTYLADGKDTARLKMPALFEVPVRPPVASVSSPEIKRFSEQAEATPVVERRGAEFLAQAPARLAGIRKVLSELGTAFDDAERQLILIKLHEMVSVLKAESGCWELRPAWQMSSALESLLKLLIDKGNEVTPSTLGTVSSALNVLSEVSVPGVRPELVITPPISILAVDDNPLCLRAVVFALEKAGLTPDVTGTGEEAVALATRKAYDVIFMDIQMPGIDGLAAGAQIRETEKNQDTPVIFVTVRSDFHTRAQSKLLGETDLIAKPFLQFEITVKALTFAMRKRLQLAASLERTTILMSANRAEKQAA